MLLLPLVVNVVVFVRASKSHGTREARLPTTMSQPGAERQHHVLRVSVLGLPHGYMSVRASGGVAGKAFQRAQ